jgi:transmembrane sensor
MNEFAVMKHDPFSLTELIRNDDFIAWVLHPDAVNDLHWRQFLEANPRKRETVESAREYVIVLAVDTGRHMPSINQSAKMWEAVEKGMRDG